MLKIIKKKVIVFLMVLFTLVNLSVSFENLPNQISVKFGSEVQAATNPVLRTPFIVDQRQKAFLSYSNNTWNTVYTNDLLSNAGALNISYDGSKCYFIHCDTNTWTYTLYYYDFNLNTIIKCTGTEGVRNIVTAIDGNLYWSKDFVYEPNNRYRYSKVYAYNPITDTNTYIMQTSLFCYLNTGDRLMNATINTLAMSLDLKLLYTFYHNNPNIGDGCGAGCYDVKNSVSLGYTCGGSFDSSGFVILSDNTVFITSGEDYCSLRTSISNIYKVPSDMGRSDIYFGWTSIYHAVGASYVSGANQTIIGKSDGSYWYKSDFEYGQVDKFSVQTTKDYNNRYTIMSNGEAFTTTLYSDQYPAKYPIKEPQLPSLSINTPTINEKISEQTNCTPSITVSDADGDTLTCKFYINSALKETRTISNTATDKTVSFNALNIGTLSEGSHTLKFEVSDGIAQPVSETISILVDKRPTISNVTWTPQDTSISISVNASDTITPANNLQYQYTVGTMVSGWKSSNTHTITPLSPDNNYTVKVEVKDESGNITTSEQQVRTKLQVPQVTTSNIAVDSMDINISDSNPTTTQYQVMVGSSYVTSSGTLSSSAQWIALINNKVTALGLSQNTPYTVKVKAKNSAGTESAFSQQITATTLAQPPNNIVLERGINSLKLTWDAINNATYIVEIDGNTSDVVTVTENTYTHNNLDADSTHQYRIRTVNVGGAGPWSIYISGTTFPNPPETAPVLSITGKTQSSITIAWDAVASADGYEIETDEGVDSTEDLNLIYTTANSYTFENLEPDSLHKYHIRAKNEGGHSGWSTTIEETTLPKPPAIPQHVNGTSSSRYSINLSWDETEGADGYIIEIMGNNSSYAQTTTSTAITIDGLLANTSYSYKIRAYNEGGSSGWSDDQIITTWPEIPKAPTNIMATAEIDSIALNWYNSAFAESYEIEIDENIIVDNINATTYTSTGLTQNSNHNYRIRARNISGVSEWSGLVEIYTLPQDTLEVNDDTSMANIVAVVTNKSVTLSWQAVKADAQYEVEVDGEIVDNGKNTVYNQSGLEPSSFHSYRVRTKDANGLGKWCAAIALSTLPNPPNAPKDIIANATNTQIELTWTSEADVAYDIEIDGVVVDAGEVSSYVHSNLAPGTTHTYRVRGKNITGVTAWSNPITISTSGLSYQIACTSGTEFNFALLAANIQAFGDVTFVVTYSPEELEVIDLCDYTQECNITSGKIAGTNITVQYTAGRIEFTVNESILPGKSWSGEITTIIFNPKINGMANINFNIE